MSVANIHPMILMKSSDNLLPFISQQHQQQHHHRRQHQHWHSSAALAFVSRSSSSHSTHIHHINTRALSSTFRNSRKSTEFSLAVSNDITTNTTAASLGDGACEFVPQQQQIPPQHKASNRKDGRRKVSDINRERNARMHSLYLEETGQSNRKMSTTSTAISTTTTSDSGYDNNNHIIDNVPRMFAVKVVTCPRLQSELNMNGREKRGRMFVERPSCFSLANLPSSTSTVSTTASHTTNSASNEIKINMEMEVGLEVADDHACTSLSALRRTIHEFFRRLQKGTYVLSASLPEFDEEGNILIHDEDGDIDEPGSTTILHGNLETWPLESNHDVYKAFNAAEEYFLQHRRKYPALRRPTLVLHVTKDPNAPAPPPPPLYLTKMPDPKTSPTMTMLSFYAFPPHGIADPQSSAELLKRTWKPFAAVGRVYIANEGVNAQMSVPTNVLSAFLTCCCATTREDSELYSILGPYVENGINVDPDPVDRLEFEKNPPFTGLHIRVRDQIVADGFDKPLNWQSAGYDMPPLEWHQRLKEARMKRRDGEDESLLPIVLDCRNDYESEVGNFLLAEPLNTTNFRESWDVLKERLKDVPKDAPIMTYCTVRALLLQFAIRHCVEL